jgi:hypothetical protein
MRIARGDVFRNRATGGERQVLRVVRSIAGRPVGEPPAECLGHRPIEIALARLQDAERFERIPGRASVQN